MMYTSSDASINFVQNWIEYKNAIEDYYTCIIGGFTNLETDPTGGQARCSIGDINLLMPPTTRVIMHSLRAISIWWYPISTWNDSAASVYWQTLPTPLQDIITKTLATFHSVKVLPIATTEEKVSPDELELAKLKLKAKGKGSLDVEETKDIETT